MLKSVQLGTETVDGTTLTSTCLLSKDHERRERKKTHTETYKKGSEHTGTYIRKDKLRGLVLKYFKRTKCNLYISENIFAL